MWILPKQLHTSAYAQDTKALGLDSEEFSQICERSLTWRGKDSLSRTWLQRWKRENWMQHLCSRTLKPSLTESFVDAWTSSLEDSRANPSVLLESVKQLKTPDTSSLTSQTESESANLELFSLKTYKGSSLARQPTESQFSNMSSESWKAWVTEQRQEYSQRKKSAHLTRENESSSLAWPTASVAGCVEGGVAKNVEMTSSGFKATRENGTSYGAKLRDSVIHHEENWATPNVCGNHNRKGASKTSGDGLSTQVKNWATPVAMNDGIYADNSPNKNNRHSEGLATQVKNWATPNTMDHMEQRSPEALQRQFNTTRKGRTAPANLREQVHPENWPTPTTAEGTKIGNQPNFGQVGLSNHPSIVGQPDRAKLNKSGKNPESWPTPRANKVHPQITEENREHLANRNKANLEEDIAGHCGKATGKLNPDWVEHLMGLPVGWTQLPTAWTDSGCSATEL